jgi:hypothetical protein
MQPNQITVEVTIDLNEALSNRFGGYDREGEPIEAAPPTLAQAVFDAVVDKIAERVVALAPSDYYPNMRKRAREVLEQKLGEQAADMAEDALAQVVVETDRFGQPKGQPRTFREYMTDQIQAWLKAPAPGSSYGSPRKTNAQKVVEDALDHKFTRELSAEIEKGKREVLRAVSARAAELMTKALGGLAEKGR